MIGTQHKRIILSIALLISVSAVAYACSVPVFRYALERWTPDSFTAVIVHSGPLPAPQQEAFDFLLSHSWDKDGNANIRIFSLDTSTDPDPEVLKHLPEKLPATPYVYLFYPTSFGSPKIIWESDFTIEAARKIITSKIRKEIADEIIRGRTATWVLIKSGNTEADDNALSVLKTTLLSLQEELRLPDGVITQSGDVTGNAAPDAFADPENELRSGIPLMISFSVIQLPGQSEDEPVLLSMFLNMESDLKDLRDQPMVFPVFGRGRSFEPLVGKGINPENVQDMTLYLCGACSCQIKAQNPGIDLLFDVDWDAWIGTSDVIQEKDLPPLSGVADIIGQTSSIPELVEVKEITTETESETTNKHSLNTGIMAAIFILVLVVAAGTIMLGRKRENQGNS